MFVDRPIGIDLGTTNSEVALLDPSERDLVVYTDRFGRRAVPSALAWDPKKEAFVVGRAARNRRGRDPGPIESVKRRMGQPGKVAVGPHELTPEEVSAKILEFIVGAMLDESKKKLPEGVELRLGRAVITVPAYFDAPQIEATRKAGELAGLEVLGVLQEPTAAAIYHTWRRGLGDGCFLVYDLGGGTFDVSILRCLAGEYQVLAIDGDNFLGGDDLDRRYAEHLRKQLVEQGYRLDLDVQGDSDDAHRFTRLVHLAQEIKESLSTADVVPVSRDGLFEDQDGEPVSFEAEVGREQYETVVTDLVEITLACCDRALARAHEVAGIDKEAIDHIVLVGGSTRVPLVVRRVTEHLCGPAKCETPLQEEVDTCVALGAAIHAAQLGGLRLGDETSGACVRLTSPLVAKGDTLKLAAIVEGPEGTRRLEVRRGEASVTAGEVGTVPSATLRLAVPLGEGEETATELVLCGDGQDVLGRLPLTLYRGDVRPRASALSRPSVVAKDIAVEVARAGQRQRCVLIERGAPLPLEAEHRFYTGDRSGAVVLRLLQNRLPIKTLVIEVPPELEVGSPVELTLRCDESMQLEARAKVGDQELWASIEPAQLEAPKGADAVDKLLAEAESVGRALWGREAQLYRRELEPLATGLREVLTTDPGKAAALGSRLELLVEEFRDASGDGLNPPWHRFEALLDTLRRVVYRSAGELLGQAPEVWEDRITGVLDKGREAWEARDVSGWRRAYNEAQALYETASEHEFADLALDDPAYIARRLSGALRWAGHLGQDLEDFVPSAASEVRGLQLAERDRLLAALRSELEKRLQAVADGDDPKLTRRTLDQVGAELERIETACARLPQLGLVTERGGE